MGTSLAAARRELAEETGLDPAAVQRRPGLQLAGAPVHRAFLARYGTARPVPARSGLMPDEQQSLAGHAWLPGLEPSGLPAIIRRLGTPPATA